jgi:hypothetical protein
MPWAEYRDFNTWASLRSAGLIDLFFGMAFYKEVSFRPEQDGFLVLRSGGTPAFRDVR